MDIPGYVTIRVHRSFWKGLSLADIGVEIQRAYPPDLNVTYYEVPDARRHADDGEYFLDHHA